MARGKKAAKAAGPDAPFEIGQTVKLADGAGPSMTVHFCGRRGDDFFVNVVFFGQTERSAERWAGLVLVERTFDSRVLRPFDDGIPF